MISAAILADSLNEFGDRLTTMKVTMPRIILAEFNTHRMFSRNSASSRAIPFEKMVETVQNNPFIPIAWQKNHKGMQGSEYLVEDQGTIEYLTDSCGFLSIYDKPGGKEIKGLDSLEAIWRIMLAGAIRASTQLKFRSVTKQLCNRLLEPFMWTTVIVSATEWENFFALRCPQYSLPDDTLTFRSWKDVIKSSKTVMEAISIKGIDIIERLKLNKGQSEIHMMALAEAMWDAYQESTPKQLKADEWHIPFEKDFECYGNLIQDLAAKHSQKIEFPSGKVLDKGKTFTECYDMIRCKIATARCARVSYTTVDTKKIEGDQAMAMNMELNATQLIRDIELHDRLLASKHLSPFEHCAKAMDKQEYEALSIASYNASDDTAYRIKGRLANFTGFIQYRHML